MHIHAHIFRSRAMSDCWEGGRHSCVFMFTCMCIVFVSMRMCLCVYMCVFVCMKESENN